MLGQVQDATYIMWMCRHMCFFSTCNSAVVPACTTAVAPLCTGCSGSLCVLQLLCRTSYGVVLGCIAFVWIMHVCPSCHDGMMGQVVAVPVLPTVWVIELYFVDITA
jgi:hypothetical protein